MARRVLGTGPESGSGSQLSVRTRGAIAPPASRARVEERLRSRRSHAHVEALARLDAGTHLADHGGLEALLAAISAEFPDLGIAEHPLGLVARCYLGPPFEVHVCDLGGGILEHFESHRPMPAEFERARSLALHPAYRFVEVYASKLCAVMADGSVAVVDS